MSRCPPRIRPNDIALSNVQAPGSALTGLPPASVSSGWCHAVLGHGAGADQAVLRLEVHVHAGRHEVGDQRRNADAEVDEHAVAQLLRDALGDDGLGVHGVSSCATR